MQDEGNCLMNQARMNYTWVGEEPTGPKTSVVWLVVVILGDKILFLACTSSQRLVIKPYNQSCNALTSFELNG